jgi:hypothetical protein
MAVQELVKPFDSLREPVQELEALRAECLLVNSMI